MHTILKFNVLLSLVSHEFLLFIELITLRVIEVSSDSVTDFIIA